MHAGRKPLPGPSPKAGGENDRREVPRCPVSPSDPKATDEELAQIAAQCGVEVTPQAVDQRHTPALVRFLEALFRAGAQRVVGSDRSLAPVLERFASVTVLDSSTIQLPDGMGGQFAGCGGRCGFGRAALKLQTEWDLRSGALSCVQVEPGRGADGGTSRQWARRGAGSLRVTDLGYFNLAVFADMAAHGEHFLSRLQFGTGVLLPDGTAVDLLAWLAGQPGPAVDRPALLGADQRLPGRLIAWRVPREQADRRRRKLRREMRRRNGRQPSADRLAWCDWTILVTSVPPEALTAAEAAVVYRARFLLPLIPVYPRVVRPPADGDDVRLAVAVQVGDRQVLDRHAAVIDDVPGPLLAVAVASPCRCGRRTSR